MTRVIDPKPPFHANGMLTCPDCGRTHWGSGICRGCGANLIGPHPARNRLLFVDPRSWLIHEDGSATLWRPDLR